MSPPGPRSALTALALAALALAALALAALALLALARPAPAAAEPSLADEPATDLVTAPLRPARHHLWVALGYELDLSSSRGGSRALAPDLTLGLTDDVSLALAHSARSIARIDHPGGLCVTDCDQRPSYAAGLLLQHRLIEARPAAGAGQPAAARPGLAVDAQVGLLLRDPDPAKPALLLGAVARWQRGRFAVESAPYLQLGLANRDAGNRHRLVIPLRALVQPTCRWAVGLHSGVNGELAVFGDAYHVPFAFVVRARPLPWLHLSLEGGLASLGGPQNNSRRRFAALTLETRL
jgi:hypothetical protein